MKEIGAYEAKTHFSKILAQVKNGELFTITHHGLPIAELRPINQRNKEKIKESIKKLRDFQSKHRLKGLKIKDLIAEGRKY
ncbi:MAG: type II toxin-antitoxin system prevent-host-death family antitoxin [Deltaproteobacteria bacterium]|nr:type II toxin-antitoxin system prevent-host-death family antitoxin [Deltaproteobacteria bacterium]